MPGYYKGIGIQGKILGGNMKEKINCVRIGERDYPGRLSPLINKPEVLYYLGNLPDDNLPSAAVIGARACSNYGRVIAEDIGQTLSNAGIQVISGLARGIDTYGALGALKGKTPTYAVLGSGVNICYPAENAELFHEILNNGGGIISEYPPDTKPLSWHFPMRNRIISGLSDKIIVVEAKEKSGSLITVEWALEQGKDILAVPGRVGDALSSGCNRLIKTGAGIISSMETLLEEFYLEYQKNSQKMDELEGDLKIIYNCLELQPKSLNEIAIESKFDYGKVISLLLKLQQIGYVKQPVENYFVRG